MKKKKEDLRYLNPGELVFERTEGGLLSLKMGKKTYPRVNLYRSFPLSDKNTFISVRDEKDQEIGIIESFADFSRSARLLMEQELQRRYFSPVITEILSLKEEFGYGYWDVRTDAGSVRFTVRTRDNNIIATAEGKLLIIDVEGNRFELPDYKRLAIKYQKILEPYI